MQRIFDWFGDHPTAKVTGKTYRAHSKVQLKARLSALKGLKAVSYDWQVGSTILKSTKKPTTYKFPHAGKYKVRVAITDSRGHTAVSNFATVTVH